MAPAARPTDHRFLARIEIPPGASALEYYLEATDARGTTSTWPPEGRAAPRRVHAGHATTPPAIEHEPVRTAAPGAPLAIRARITAGAPLARATLHYRNVNQMQNHDRLEMARTDGPATVDDATAGDYLATIPAAHITPEWDVMYHLEAVDVLGNAAFYPGLTAGTPYVVAAVDR
jgi:hypothetical protein